MKPLDYTLYNKVKEKFPPQPLAVIFVSLKPENIEALRSITFNREKAHELFNLINEYAKNAFPFAAIGGFSENEVGYNFCCRDFEQEENLLTGEIIKSSIGTYHSNPIDIEDVKKDLRKLSMGTLLSGNA